MELLKNKIPVADDKWVVRKSAKVIQRKHGEQVVLLVMVHTSNPVPFEQGKLICTAYKMQIRAYQEVVMENNPSIKTLAMTWESSSKLAFFFDAGADPELLKVEKMCREDLQECLAAQSQEFAVDFLKANE